MDGHANDDSVLLVCKDCNYPWRRSFRLPTTSELIRCAVLDRKARMRSVSSIFWFIVMSNLVAILFVLTGHPAVESLYASPSSENDIVCDANDDNSSDVGDGSSAYVRSAFLAWLRVLYEIFWIHDDGPPLAIFMLQQVVLLHLFLSRRFEVVVMTLWLRRGMYMEFYFQLYLYFVVAVVVVVCSFTPILEILTPVVQSWLQVCGSVCRAVAWINFLVYLVVANIVLFIFFRTNYRVSTIRDHSTKVPTTPEEGHVPFLHRRPFDITDENS